MYVRHTENDHDKVQAKYKHKAGTGPDAPTDNGAHPSSQRLVVSQNLREVLCSRLMVGDEDADEICADICSQVKRLGPEPGICVDGTLFILGRSTQGL